VAEVDGLYYEVHGTGPPLILSSGLGGSAGYWASNLPALAEHFRVIVYDHRGTGRSDRNGPGTTGVADMAVDVVTLMDALAIERADFIGHALGGMIGLETGISTGRIDRLVVINGWVELDPHTRRCFDVRLTLLRDSGAEAFLHAQPLFLYPPDWISSHDAELRAEAAHQLAHFAGAETTRRRIDAVRSYVPDLVRMRDIPALLAIATRDDMLVPMQRSLDVAAHVPGARTATFDWGGHACNVTDPDTFNRLVLEFLRS
jgi:aminoacrylate hydrolase